MERTDLSEVDQTDAILVLEEWQLQAVAEIDGFVLQQADIELTLIGSGRSGEAGAGETARSGRETGEVSEEYLTLRRRGGIRIGLIQPKGT